MHPCAPLLAFCAARFSRARVRWVDRPAGSKPRVYFANHSSHFDFVVLWAALPPSIRLRTRPVAAQEYWQSTPLRSWISTHVFRSLLVPRIQEAPLASRAALTPLIEQLDRGGSLILFPEGTRGDGIEVAGFKAGLYQLCRERPDVEAVPVYLENLHRVLPRGRILPKRHTSSVTFGSPLRLGGGEGNREFLTRAREALLALKGR